MGDSNTVLRKKQSLLMLVGFLNVFTTAKYSNIIYYKNHNGEVLKVMQPYDQLNANITGHYTI